MGSGSASVLLQVVFSTGSVRLPHAVGTPRRRCTVLGGGGYCLVDRPSVVRGQPVGGEEPPTLHCCSQRLPSFRARGWVLHHLPCTHYPSYPSAGEKVVERPHAYHRASPVLPPILVQSSS
eukprot:3316841-Rhodomonas_salina.1